MRVRYKISSITCFALLCLLTVSACAQNQSAPLADVPPPDKIRFVGPDDATSKCIGNPKTPLCAMETFFACSARQDMDLCRKVGVTDFSYPSKKYTTYFRVLTARVLTQDDMTEDLKDTNWWRPGFVKFTTYETFSEDEPCPDECRFSYIANPVDNEWHIISWTWWGVQDPDDPGPEH